MKSKDLSAKSTRAFRGILAFIALAILVGCASIGHPEGGPRDEKPPVFVRSNPRPGQLNYDRQKIELYFDENIQLDDAFNKVIVSPAQKMPPVVRSLGRRVTVELRDSLVPDATYTIDFGDAIKDLNEGNILDGFAFDFSTGDDIDTLRISGLLLEAETLEPAQGMLVGIYSNLADSAITTLPLERVTRTNSRGQYTIRGLKEGQYRIFAIDDVNRDNRWDRTESVAFFDVAVSPSVESIVVNDTLRDASGQDSIVSRPGVAYLPADVLLTWFKEDYKPHYMTENSRPARNRVTITMSAPYDSVPTASIVNTPALEGMKWEDITVADISQGNDTVTWWIRAPEALGVDSLTLALRYPRTDSLENVVMYNDTVRFFYRPSSDELRRQKELAKLREKGADTIPEPQTFMSLKGYTAATHDVYNPYIFEVGTPIARVDTSLIRLQMLEDTVWVDAPFTGPLEIPGSTILRRKIDFTPTPGAKYRFEADSAAFVDIYDNPNNYFKQEFTVRKLDDYSTVIFNLTPADTTIIVQLLDARDTPVRQKRADASGKVVFDYVNPATYYARLYYDDNGDGKWTPGVVADFIQPEEVAYFPKKIDARANWDVELDWDVYSFPIDVQKPYAILKNKPKLKKGEVAPTDDEEVDEWGQPINRTGNNNGRNNSGFGGFGNFGGGLGGRTQNNNNSNTSNGFRR